MDSNFFAWVYNSLIKNQSIVVVDDQISNPTYIKHMADAIFKCIILNATGIYHIVGSDRISKYEFALMISDVFQFESSYISPSGIDTMEQLVKRPKDMSLSYDKTQKALQISIPQIRPSIVKLAEMHKARYADILESSYT